MSMKVKVDSHEKCDERKHLSEVKDAIQEKMLVDRLVSEVKLNFRR